MLPAALVLIFTLSFLICSYLFPMMGGYGPDLLPIPQPDPPIQPAGYAFALWGLIYLWLLISAVYGLWKRAESYDWQAYRPAMILTLLVGTPWTWIASQSAVWATVAIWVMLAGALAAVFATGTRDHWFLRGPVALLTGWLTAASSVSLGVTLAGFGIGFDILVWSHICLVLALLIALFVQAKLPGAPEYGLGVIWALVGIIVTNGSGQWSMTLLAAFGILLVGMLTFRSFNAVEMRS